MFLRFFVAIKTNMTPLVLVTGFLGAGKTTFLRDLLLDARAKNLNVGVIINEFGDVDVDGTLLSDAAQSLATIAGGCACCAGQDDFLEAVETMSGAGFDALIVEASGLADPLLLLESLAAPALISRVRVAHIVCVADASNWNQSAGILGPLLRRQLTLADTIVLSKTDLVEDTALNALQIKLAQLNPRADVATLQDSATNWNWNFAPRTSNIPDLPLAPHAHSHTLWIALPHPLERAPLEAQLNQLSGEIWRAKGFVRLRGHAELQLVQLSGGPDGNRVRIAPFAAPFGADEPNLGLVFIGARLDENELKRAFETLTAF